MTQNDLWQLNNEDLNALYEREMERLQQRLLSGASWEETTADRKQLAAISSVLYKKHNPANFKNPAEEDRRNSTK
jgi:hypothetical protein